MEKYNVDGFLLPPYIGSVFPGLEGLAMVAVLMWKSPAGTPINKGSAWNRIDGFCGECADRLNFLDGRWEEEKLIPWAIDFEQRTQWKKVDPSVKPKTQLLAVLFRK